MENRSYATHQGINRPVELYGFKAQYLLYLVLSLIGLFLSFVLLYALGLPALGCVSLVGGLGGGWAYLLHRWSQRYGTRGLLKFWARRQLPSHLSLTSRTLFMPMNHEKRPE